MITRTLFSGIFVIVFMFAAGCVSSKKDLLHIKSFDIEQSKSVGGQVSSHKGFLRGSLMRSTLSDSQVERYLDAYRWLPYLDVLPKNPIARAKTLLYEIDEYTKKTCATVKRIPYGLFKCLKGYTRLERISLMSFHAYSMFVYAGIGAHKSDKEEYLFRMARYWYIASSCRQECRRGNCSHILKKLAQGGHCSYRMDNGVWAP